MKIRALIVDDEALARQMIRSLISADREIEVVGECGDGREAIAAIKKFQPDLMFLDIQMPGLSGFHVLEKVDPQQMPYVIFITAYSQYAVKAFEFHALDYLLKPFDKERFFESVNRAKKIIRQQGLSGLTEEIIRMIKAVPGAPLPGAPENSQEEPFLQQITIREGERIFALDVEDIVWMEAANQYTRIHTLSASHLVSCTLKAVQSKLDPRKFFRIHRSTIIHVKFIHEVRTAKNGVYSVLLTTGKCLKLSRSRRGVLADLLKYCSS
jgi:two-component system LytT family response regulator